MKPYLIGALIVILACAAVWYFKDPINQAVNQDTQKLNETLYRTHEKEVKY